MNLLIFCLLFCACWALPSRDDIYSVAVSLFESNNYQEFFSLLEEVEDTYGNLIVVGNGKKPSLYAYRGVAAYNSQNMTLAESSLSKSVEFNPVDTRSWINLGEVRVQIFKFKGAVHAFERAYALGDYGALCHLLRVKGWINNWQDFESLSSNVEKNLQRCYNSYHNSTSTDNVYRTAQEERSLILQKGNAACVGLDSSTGFEYTYLPGQVQKIGHIRSPNALDRHQIIPSQHIASLWNETNDNSKKEEGRRLKVGIVSADFGVHPVSTLIRGTLQRINTSRIELYCFSIKQSMSWWGINISSTVEHFYYLPQIDTYDAARAIAALKIEVLIDLNGHTQHSGLRLMGHRPAPLQISYLGLPTTTGASFIDYYLGDSVSLPPEHRSHFSESLAYLPHCYIANDYAQTQGDIVEYYSRSSTRASRTTFADQVIFNNSSAGLSKDSIDNSSEALSAQFTRASLFLATFSNTQKMDPIQFQVWMNIMRGIPGSMMLHIKHHGSVDSWPYLLNNAAHFGIQSDQMVLTAQTPWIEHIYKKTSLDLILDTSVKNGHTTGLDGLWAGVPTLSYGNGRVMIERAAESMQMTLGSTLGLAYSAKDYETSALRLSKYAQKRKDQKEEDAIVPPMDSDGYTEDKYVSSVSSRLTHLNELCLYNSTSFPATAQYTRLLSWREDICKKRSSSALFDNTDFSDNFVRQLQITWDVIHVQDPDKPRYHIIAGTHSETRAYTTGSSSGSDGNKKDAGIPLDQVYSSQSEVYSVEAGTRRRGASITVADPSGEPAFIKSLSVPHTDKMVEAIHNVQNAKQSNIIKEDNTKEYPTIPDDVWKQKYIFLNIGGIAAKEGWFNVNAQQHDIAHKDGILLRANIDIFRQMNDLYGFPDNSVSAIYASHILEHNRFGDQALEKTLQEWKRVLRPGGLLMISVPDLTTVFQLYLSPSLALKDRWLLTKVIYGAQSDEYDYHYVGFDWSLLSIFLSQNGFCNIERVGSFNLFSDSSEIVLFNKSISLNVAARKCSESEEHQGDFSINHNADPYVPYEFPHDEICSQCPEKREKEDLE